jgi:hypothetical protein
LKPDAIAFSHSRALTEGIAQRGKTLREKCGLRYTAILPKLLVVLASHTQGLTLELSSYINREAMDWSA